MKLSGWISVAFLASTALSLETAVPSVETLPFSQPQIAESRWRAFEVLQILRKRADNCPSGYDACSKLGHSDICCKDNTICTRDDANNIACCPTGASCTGTLSTTGTGVVVVGDSTSSFRFPQTASATQTTDGPTSATLTGSTLAAAYPFVVIPTSFANGQVCTSYYSQCQSEYTGCLSQLGGGYAVTVAVDGGAGTTRAGVSAAMSTCSSLSLEACHGLNLGYCAAYSTGVHENRATGLRHTTSLADLFFGMVIGVAGMFI
ncbi:uncharacterized protein BO97DRAFT_380432 [Aspergillus homomorphus CBS 101889]|uniref:GPI anchored protein n=1 Tax=Aspergillus homomorphus (strain CBS 101889) TaxID=1450537 RepID=A0A395IDI1_ASPHC|nr:hypothetical protein BO97DRAFT_380432 [Aspergillus homomorphus CBS 101889]RAL17213.1 hypothetical protein BO97DRAFT_380432 [Aspergillus homomorphus CBS 101889]